jgi:virginiamycin B lyase
MLQTIFRKKPLFFSMLCFVLMCLNSLAACDAAIARADQGASNTTSRVVPAEQPESVRRRQSMKAQEARTTTNPWGIALDEARGFVYVAEPGCEMSPYCKDPQTQKRVAFPTKIGKYSLADGSFIRDFTQPMQYSNPLFVAVNAADGHVWFTEPNSDAIGELSPDGERWWQTEVSANSTPYDLVFDQRGNLWFTEFTGDRIGFLNPKTRRVVETAIPTPNSNPYGLTIDRKGDLWFAENAKGIAKIGTFTPTASGVITIQEDLIDPSGSSQPHLITADPQGNIWFSEGFAGNVGKWDPIAQAATHYRVATACRQAHACTHLSGICADNRGNIWFTDSLNATVGYFMPPRGKYGGLTKVRPLSNGNAHPHDGLVVQSNGTAWFSEQYGSSNFGPALIMWPSNMTR